MSKSHTIGRTLNNSRKRHAAYLAMASAAVATLAGSFTKTAFAANTPIAGTTGWNQDLFAEPGSTNVLTTTTAPIDPGGGYAFFVAGYTGADAGYGVPASDATTVFTSLSNASTQFIFQPFGGAGNTTSLNTLYMKGTASATNLASGTLTFGATNTYSTLALMINGGNGASTVKYTLNYVDGSTATGTLTATDWYGGGNTAAYAAGRIVRANPGGIDEGSGTTNPRFYESDITNPKPQIGLTGITFQDQNTSTTVAVGIYGVSGSAVKVLKYTGNDPITPSTFDTSSLNFVSGITPTAFSNGNSYVTFDDTAAATSTNVFVSGTISPALLTLANNTLNYYFSGGAIAGTGNVNVSGSAMVTFAGLNTWTGTTTITAGTVLSTGTIGTGGLTINSPAALTLNNSGGSQVIGALNGNGSIVLGNNVTLNIGSGGVYTGTITDTVGSGGSPGNVYFNGTTTFNTSANDFNNAFSNYTGTTTFNSGSVTIFSPYSFGITSSTLIFKGGGITAGNTAMTSSASSTTILTGPIQNNYQIASGATFTLGGTNSLELSGAGQLLGPATISVGNSATTALIVSGTLTGNVLLTKTGAGTLVLGASGNQISGINISGGVVNFVANGLGTTVSPVNINGGTVQFAAPKPAIGYAGNSEDISTTHILNINASGGAIDTNGNNVTFAGPINGSVTLANNTSAGVFTKLGAGSLTLTQAVNVTSYTQTGGGTAANPNLTVINGPTAVLTQFSGGNGFTVGSYLGDYAVTNVSGGATVTAPGGLNLVTFATTQTNALYLNTSAKTAFGVLNISGTGTTLNIGSNLNIGRGLNVVSGNGNVATGIINQTGGLLNVTGAGVTTQLANTTQAVGIYNLSGGTFNAASITLSVTGSTGQFNLSGGTLNAYNIAGGSGTSTFYFNGGLLNASNSSTAFISNITKPLILAGGLNLNQSAFNVSVSANLTSGVTSGTDGGLTLLGTGIVTLSGNDVFSGPIATNSPVIFSQTGTTNLSGSISGTGSLNQSGSGVTILSGASSYTGGTNVTNGTLVLLSPTALGTPGTTVNVTGNGLIGINNDNVITDYNFVFPAGTEGISFYNYSSTALSFPANTALRLGAVGNSSASENITGSSSLNFVGPGTLTLTGTNTYTGFTNVSGGFLNFLSGGLGSGPITLLGGVIQYGAGNSDDLTAGGRVLTLGAGGGGIDTGTNSATFTGNIVGTNLGVFTKYGTGTLALQSSIKPTSLIVRGGTLFLNGSSSNVSATAFTSVGLNPGDTSTLTMDNGAQFLSTSDLNIADTSSTTGGVTIGVFNLNDTNAVGTTIKVGNFYVGKGSVGTNGSGSAFAVGTFNQTAGALTLGSTSGAFVVGVYGAGTYNQTGGTVGGQLVTTTTATSGTTVTVTTSTVPAISTALLGQNAGSGGIYNLTGGSLNAKALVIGGFGTGTFTQSGGTVAGLGGISIATNNVSGSTPVTSTTAYTHTITIAQSAGSTGIYNLNGGTVTPTSITGGAGTSTLNLNGGTIIAGTSSTTFISGITAVKVGAGGAIINTNGFNVASASPVGTGVTGSNDGGLTKLGAGTLTLASTVGYTGPTTVSNGTLSILNASTANTAPITLGNGATIAVGAPATTTYTGFSGYVLNNNGNIVPTNDGSTVVLTNQSSHSASSAFSNFKVPIDNAGSFTATFTYNHTNLGGTGAAADGVTFSVQNQSSNALGGSGGSYGYKLGGAAPDTAGTAITNSGGVFLDEYNDYTGYLSNGLATNGLTGFGSLSANPTTNITVTYSGPTKTLTETYTNASATSPTVAFSTSAVDFGANLGGAGATSGAGYIGFTGATGGTVDGQSISNFTFSNSLQSAVALTNTVNVLPGATSGLVEAVSAANSIGSVGSLNVGAGSTLNVSSAGTSSPGYVISTGRVALATSATLNVANTSSGTLGTISLGAITDGGVPATLTVGGSGVVALSAPATSLVTGSMLNVSTGGTLAINALNATGSAVVNDLGTVSFGVPTAGINLGTSANNLVLNGNALNLTGPFTVTGVISDGTAAGAVNISAGGVTFNGASTYTGNTTVAAGALLTLNGTLAPTGNINANGSVVFNNTGSSILVRTKGVINVGPAGLVTVATPAAHGSRQLLVASNVTVASGGSIDLTGNDLDVTGSSLAAVTQLVANGYNYTGGANWQGSGGITSSLAAADTAHLAALGVIQNNQGGSAIFTSANKFDTTTPGAADVLVKYTYFGDANLDGKIDGSDYSLIDAGFAAAGATGWYNGDFNYDGVVDGSDYALIDNAFNNQGVQLTTPTALTASISAQVAGPTAVPEPATLSLLAVGAAGLLARRRRQA